MALRQRRQLKGAGPEAVQDGAQVSRCSQRERPAVSGGNGDQANEGRGAVGETRVFSAHHTCWLWGSLWFRGDAVQAALVLRVQSSEGSPGRRCGFVISSARWWQLTCCQWMRWSGGERNWRSPEGLACWLSKESVGTQETWVPSLAWGDCLEKGRAPHSGILAWRSPWPEGPGGCSPSGHTESDTTGRLNFLVSRKSSEHIRPGRNNLEQWL